MKWSEVVAYVALAGMGLVLAIGIYMLGEQNLVLQKKLFSLENEFQSKKHVSPLGAKPQE